jgi:hypothetical protein
VSSYASIADLRAEGVTEAAASDLRLGFALEEASRTIDRLTGWFFEPRNEVIRLSGRNTSTIELPFPPIALTHVRVGGGFWMPAYDIPLEPELVWIVGAPIRADFDVPRITLRFGYAFPWGQGNVEVEGTFGYTEPDGTPQGRTPLAIRRATMILALRSIPGVGDVEAREDNWRRPRLVEERTRDQSYRLAPPVPATDLTGEPEVDQILIRYRRPLGLGAA